MLSQLFGGKAWYKSMVGWAVFIYALAVGVPEAGLEAGVLTDSTAAVIQKYLSYVGTVFGMLGIRRRLPASGQVVGTAKVADIGNGLQAASAPRPPD